MFLFTYENKSTFVHRINIKLLYEAENAFKRWAGKVITLDNVRKGFSGTNLIQIQPTGALFLIVIWFTFSSLVRESDLARRIEKKYTQ